MFGIVKSRHGRVLTLASLVAAIWFAEACASEVGRRSMRTKSSESLKKGADSSPAVAETDDPNKSEGDDGSMPPSDEGGAPALALAESTSISMRNYAQLAMTMSTLTGVRMVAPSPVKAVFDASIAGALPNETNPVFFGGAVQFNVTKLAMYFCAAMVDADAAASRSLWGINLAAAPSEAFTPAAKRDLAIGLIKSFWGPQVRSTETIAKTVETEVKLLDELTTGRTLTTAADTRILVKLACAVTLASAPVLFY